MLSHAVHTTPNPVAWDVIAKSICLQKSSKDDSSDGSSNSIGQVLALGKILHVDITGITAGLSNPIGGIVETPVQKKGVPVIHFHLQDWESVLE